MRAPGRVWAERHVLKTVLVNLVNNALKFTPRGGAVSVSVELELDGAVEADRASGHRTVRIMVRDTGAGIPQDKLAALFDGDEVYRTRGTEGEKGSGLGLRLCSELAERIGARLTVETAPSEGTSVSLALPAVEQRAASKG